MSLAVFISRWPELLASVLWILPLGYGVYLFDNEVRTRDHLLARSVLPAAPAQQALPAIEFNPEAIATVLGLAEHAANVRSAEPLTLRASFVSSAGISRALLAGADGERLYQVGESLPGGSVLRRVEVSRVVLWRKGREEVLTLQPAIELRVLTLNPTTPRPAPPLLPLRPSADLPPSP